ncbi:hypothetical protein AMTRI_Chr04g247810 [Amborella trichopoda]
MLFSPVTLRCFLLMQFLPHFFFLPNSFC